MIRKGLLLLLLLSLLELAFRWRLFYGRQARDDGYLLAPGAILAARFRILRPLGRGGMSEVYLVEDHALDDLVALKLLSRRIARERAHLSILEREVKYARSVTHSSVCRVYELHGADRLGEELFLTMEYIDGQSLHELLQLIGRFHIDTALVLASELAWGLAAIHRRGILHRDLKPGNVLVDGEGHIRISDFGLASLSDHESRVFGGTRAYMAPEVLTSGYADERSDLYALGLVTYEMFTGRYPFEDHLVRHQPTIHPEIGLEPPAAQAILSCLEEDPERRPAAAEEVAKVFDSTRILGMSRD